jgi:hypothetical protein
LEPPYKKSPACDKYFLFGVVALVTDAKRCINKALAESMQERLKEVIGRSGNATQY